MKIIMFQPQFVPAILSGRKTSTIRKLDLKSKPRLMVNERVSARTWTKKPYRSKTSEFAILQVLLQYRIIIDCGSIIRDGIELSPSDRDAIAHMEGFNNRFDMADWFLSNHSFPFTGVQTVFNVVK